MGSCCGLADGFLRDAVMAFSAGSSAFSRIRLIYAGCAAPCEYGRAALHGAVFPSTRNLCRLDRRVSIGPDEIPCPLARLCHGGSSLCIVILDHTSTTRRVPPEGGPLSAGHAGGSSRRRI